jgi:GAF domain-containing protein
MYDPLVVDTFVKVYRDISHDTPSATISGRPFGDIEEVSTLARIEQQAAGLENIAAGSNEMLAVFDVARTLSRLAMPLDATDVIAAHVRRLVPCALAILFAYDLTRDELVAIQTTGEGAELTKGLRVPVGERLSGWVAANRQAIVNSDATLDLGNIARTIDPRLRSCLSVPLVDANHLVGVVTMYSVKQDGFSDQNRRLLEMLGVQIAGALRAQLDATSPMGGDPATSRRDRPAPDSRPKIH